MARELAIWLVVLRSILRALKLIEKAWANRTVNLFVCIRDVARDLKLHVGNRMTLLANDELVILNGSMPPLRPKLVSIVSPERTWYEESGRAPLR